MKVVLKFLEMGRISFKDIIEEIHSPDECEEVYVRLATDKNFPTVVQFDWTRLEK